MIQWKPIGTKHTVNRTVRAYVSLDDEHRERTGADEDRSAQEVVIGSMTNSGMAVYGQRAVVRERHHQ